MIVTFFGDADVSKDVYDKLLSTITFLIEEKDATLFFVGNDAHFDVLVERSLASLVEKYKNFRYRTLCPLKDIPFAEVERVTEKRKQEMVNVSQTVVTYAKDPVGTAAKFKALALRKGKTVIELAE